MSRAIKWLRDRRGGAVLTLFVKMLDRKGGVSIPIELPPRDLSHLVEQLNVYR